MRDSIHEFCNRDPGVHNPKQWKVRRELGAVLVPVLDIVPDILMQHCLTLHICDNLSVKHVHRSRGCRLDPIPYRFAVLYTQTHLEDGLASDNVLPTVIVTSEIELIQLAARAPRVQRKSDTL